jgi:hypothetical protein
LGGASQAYALDNIHSLQGYQPDELKQGSNLVDCFIIRTGDGRVPPPAPDRPSPSP